jgi:polysaccharide biosynthesis protein PslG
MRKMQVWKQRLAVVLVLLAFLLALGVHGAQPASSVQAPRFPFPQDLPNGLGITIQDLSNATLDKAVSAGFKIIRVDLQWAEVEKQKGSYNWNRYDSLVKRLTARGLRPMFILDFNNPLYSGNPNIMDAIDTPQEIQGYKNFAVAAVERYQPKTPILDPSTRPIWEMYNEPNRPQFWNPPNPQAYVNLLKVAVPAMRQANPQVFIVGPALGHDPNVNPNSTDKLDYAYLEKTLQAGLLRYVNAISIHPYPDGRPELALRVYSKVRGLVDQAQNRQGLPPNRTIWIISGEWGYSTAAYANTPQVHANYWTRMYLFNLSQKIPISIGYKLEYSTLDPGADSYELGFPLFNAQGQAKPAFTQIRDMIATLQGLSFAQQLPSPPQDYLLEFSDGTKTVMAAWTIASPHAATLYGGQYNLSGKPIFITKR